MKHLYIFLIGLISLTTPATVSAQALPTDVINVPVNIIPTLPIERVNPTPQPSPITTPAPTNIPMPSPTPSVVTIVPEQIKPAIGRPSTDDFIVPENLDDKRDADKKKDKDDKNVTTTPSITPTPAIAAPVAKTQPPKAQPKPEVQEEQTPMKAIQDIIAPPLATLMQVKGANYYQDERLAPGVTSTLISLALGLFLAGITILKLPVLMKAMKRLRRKLRNRKSADSFTIPNLEMK